MGIITTIMSSQDNNLIVNAAAFKPSKDFKYIKPKINKSGGKSVGILNTNSNKALYLSTPIMLTWGVQEFVDDQTGRKSYDMSLQFPKEEYENEQTKQFLKSMVEFQDKLKVLKDYEALLQIELLEGRPANSRDNRKTRDQLNALAKNGQDPEAAQQGDRGIDSQTRSCQSDF